MTSLLEAARAGDEDAYAELVRGHRAELHAHCYRMLGSVADAEDALQETLLRAWRGLPRFEERSSLRSWLYRIATNVCLRAVERRPKRVLSIDHGPAAALGEAPGEPLAESVWIEPYAGELDRYEERESVELAFIAALQHLPARQRAVLILRDVLGFSAREVADTLDATPASVDSALQRAHKSVDERLPEITQQATLRALGDAALRELVDSYVGAWDRGDVDALVAMLADDVVLAMPPVPTWYRGRAAVERFLRERPMAGDRRWRVVPTRANGQLAFSKHQWDGARFVPHSLNVVTLRGREIAEITAFLF